MIDKSVWNCVLSVGDYVESNWVFDNSNTRTEVGRVLRIEREPCVVAEVLTGRYKGEQVRINCYVRILSDDEVAVFLATQAIQA